MTAYSFQRQFIRPIELRTKGQTIREVGKRRHATPGKMIQLYFAMRTKHCRKIIEDQRCLRTDRVRLNFGHTFPAHRVTIGPDFPRATFILAGRQDLDRFAVLDGFENWEAMDDFWKLMHPDHRFFDGIMVGWLEGFWK